VAGTASCASTGSSSGPSRGEKWLVREAVDDGAVNGGEQGRAVSPSLKKRIG
jgi:hypothetical protein